MEEHCRNPWPHDRGQMGWYTNPLSISHYSARSQGFETLSHCCYLIIFNLKMQQDCKRGRWISGLTIRLVSTYMLLSLVEIPFHFQPLCAVPIWLTSTHCRDKEKSQESHNCCFADSFCIGAQPWDSSTH